jgi:hypothetical protein
MEGALLSVTTIEKVRNKGTPATRQKGDSQYYTHVTVFTVTAVAGVHLTGSNKSTPTHPPLFWSLAGGR